MAANAAIFDLLEEGELAEDCDRCALMPLGPYARLSKKRVHMSSFCHLFVYPGCWTHAEAMAHTFAAMEA